MQLSRRPLHVLALLAVAAPGSAGCFASTSQMEVANHRLAALERSDAERSRQLTDAVTRANAQVAALNEQLEQARAQTRDLANLGSRIDSIEDQLRSVNGGLDEVRHTMQAATTDQASQRTALQTQFSTADTRITALERRVGLAPPVDPNQIPSNPADIMTQANQAYGAHDYNRARFLANALLQRAPQDALADDAHLLIGRTYLQENRAATAVQEFQRLLSDFPSADTVPAAMTDMVEAFIRLGLCQPAERTLRLLIDRHGSTPQGQAARQRLQDVRRLPRAACTG